VALEFESRAAKLTNVILHCALLCVETTRMQWKEHNASQDDESLGCFHWIFLSRVFDSGLLADSRRCAKWIWQSH